MLGALSPRFQIALAGAALALGAVFTFSGIARAAAAQLWPFKPFVQCTPDPRIWCEPGAQGYARALAPLLPAALCTVERAQYGPFAGAVEVYVYSSIDTYARYGGGPEAGGRVAFGVVHMAPVLRGQPARHAPILTHELSHLHLGQRAGLLAMMRLPVWFREGYATLVSGGGGAGDVTPDNAVFALVHGRHFEAEEGATLLAPHKWEYFKLPAPMFYRQSALLVEYLQRRDPAAFARMIGAVAARTPFGDAVRDAYGQPLAVLWQDFRSGLRKHPAAHWNFSPAS